MKKQLLISLVLILRFTAEAFCCLDATQERIFPIGTSEGCMVGVEFISRRYGGMNNEEVWNFDIAFRGYNEDYSDYTIIEFDEVKKIGTDSVSDMINDYLSRAIDYSKSLNDFEAFRPVSIAFCDFLKDCSCGKLTVDKDQLKLKYNGTTHSISYLDTTYTGKMAQPYINHFEFYFDESSPNVRGYDLKISSVRN